MNVRNFLKPGSYAYPIPLGVPMTLQYNVEGNIEKVFYGIGESIEDRTKEIMSFMLQHNTIPAKLSVAGGTTFVLGVLYTGDIPKKELALHQFQGEQYDKYRMNPEKFNFFAFDIDCTATRISGGLAKQSTLSMNKFNTLQVQMTPALPTDETISTWTSGQYWNFIPGICMAVFSEMSSPDYNVLNVQSIVVKKIEKITDETGCIKAIINSESGIILNVDYSEVVGKNIKAGDTLYLNYNNSIAFILHKNNDAVNDTISCEFCGRRFRVPHFGEVYCPDEHCLSRFYPEVQRFLKENGLQTMEYNRYKALVESHSITAFPDILLLPEYEDVKVDTSIDKILRSMISPRLIRSMDVLTMFANAMRNNIKSFIFYVDHPDRIRIDLSIQHPDLNRLIMWLSDDMNASDVKTIIMSKQFNIKKQDIRFEGAPIFRNKKYCITGNFVHGDYAEVMSILRSYSADVTTDFDQTVSAVLVGSTQENFNGEILRSARSIGIPVFDEVAFFSRHQIDEDLRNLV